MQRLRALTAPAWIVVGAVALRAVIPFGFVNYDTLYALVWGGQLSRGETPSYGTAIAPTPHPLIEVLGVVLSFLGSHAIVEVKAEIERMREQVQNVE